MRSLGRMCLVVTTTRILIFRCASYFKNSTRKLTEWSIFQGALTATFDALRHASPATPALGNIGQSDLARRRRKSRVNVEPNATTLLWMLEASHIITHFFFKKKFDWSHLKKLFERDAFYFYQSVIYVLSSRPAAHLPFFSKQYPPYLILIWNWKCIIEKNPSKYIENKPRNASKLRPRGLEITSTQ